MQDAMTASTQERNGQTRPRDAVPASFVDRLPPVLQAYARLMRLDRPIGIWLLLWPCLMSLALALPFRAGWMQIAIFAALFALGSVVMRGAGCTYNDIVDRDIDAKVARTAGRPLPSGAVTLKAAAVFLAAQALAGLLVLLQFNAFSVWLGVASLLPIAVYPFMKRITHWPQAWLGLTFNWGALMGWSAMTGGLALAPLLLYAGCILWTLGYDTIYALQDKEDDALIGVKSTALLFGDRTRPWVSAFYAGAFALWTGAALAAGAPMLGLLSLVPAGLHLARQAITLDIAPGGNALSLFRSNRETGLLATLGFAVTTLI